MTQIQKQNVPKLRFPEFEGTWEETSIGGLGQVITGSTPDTSVSEYYGGEIPFFSPSDVPIRGGQITSSAKTLSEYGFAKTRKIPAKSTLFVCIGSTIGKVGQTQTDSATNQQINAVVPSADNDPQFVHLALVRAAPRVRELTAVQAVPIINKTTFQKEKLRRPLLPEQRKIASFLGAVDEKIAHLSRKKALLEDYKKGCMQQLFSQKLRFKDDDGNDFPEWVEMQLGDVAQVFDGTHQTPNYVEEGVSFYSVEHVTSNKFSQTKFISEEVFEKENKRVLLEKGVSVASALKVPR